MILIKTLLFFILFFALILASGCVGQSGTLIEPQVSPGISIPEEACTKACGDTLASGINLDSGPCLLNPIPEAPEWVCDVAHWPREEIDNVAENQCSAYRAGSASHFVEVMPDCVFIRAS